ncbi:MAG: ABC transporter ATP-binding protein [Gammaproteobacteria bacterium]|nr:ABC transporter ATP-binding protein [Gammaproteobacteria bacterium]
MNEVVVQAEKLAYAYGHTPVLQDISLSINGGEIYGLVGADGAGKSTLLSLAAGQLAPHSGILQVLGKASTEPNLRGDIAYMPQNFGLYPDLSIMENMQFFADLHGLANQAAERRITDLLTRTGLKGFEARRSGNLSGGMMQKLALASVLVHDPKVMFLDEPTTGVDPVSRRAFWRLLESVRAEGVAILFATANMDEAERCDRVGMLQNGKLTREGAPLDLIQQNQAQLAAVFGPSVRQYREKIRQLPSVEMAFPVGIKLNVWLRDQTSLQTLKQDLSTLSQGLDAKLAIPSLHDATLRDLALAQQSRGG